MNELIERGLRSAASALASALDDRPDIRPRQFTREDPITRDRRRARRTEEQLEQAAPSEGQRPQLRVEVEPPPVRGSQGARMLRRELRDRESVKRAFLLSEVLDRPRALRPYRQQST